MERVSAVKIVLLGDPNVGKTSIITRYTDSLVSHLYNPTIGIDFKVKQQKIFLEETGNEKDIRLNIWDTAGQEKFRSITATYFRNTDCCGVVFDLAKPFEEHSVLSSIKIFSEYARISNGKFQYLLIGNKSDILENLRESAKIKSKQSRVEPKRTLNTEEVQYYSVDARRFADEHDFTYIEVSAFTGKNIDECFKLMATFGYEYIQQQESAYQDKSEPRLSLSHGSVASEPLQRGCCS